MRWDALTRSIGQMCAADPTLAGIYGTAIRWAGSKSWQVPSLDYLVVADTIDEQWNPVTIQFDQWCSSMAGLVASERRLRLLFHVELPSDFGGIMAFAQYEEGAPLTDAPDRDNVYARALRFRFTPLRSLYDRTVVS